MPGKRYGAEFGFDPEELPDELTRLVERLQEHAAEESLLKGKSRRKKLIPNFRGEAEHYWEEACFFLHETPNSVIAHAVQAFRERFKKEFKQIEVGE